MWAAQPTGRIHYVKLVLIREFNEFMDDHRLQSICALNPRTQRCEMIAPKLDLAPPSRTALPAPLPLMD